MKATGEYTDREKEIIDTLLHVPYKLVREFPNNPKTGVIYIVDRGIFEYEDGEIIQVFEEYIWRGYEWVLIDRIEHKDEVAK